MPDTDKVVKKLLKKMEDHLEELGKIYNTLNSIQEITGISIDMPDISNLKSFGIKGSSGLTKNTSIKPDQFFRKSKTKASEEYLRMVGHGVPLGEIIDALTKGGVTFKGDARKSLYTQLVRATRKFVKIGEGLNATFGLIDFYPDRVKKKQAVKTGPEQERNNSEKTTDESINDVEDKENN